MDEDRARCLEDLDRTYVWHPFTPMREYQDRTPLVIERGEGIYLYDTHGNRFIDGVASLWVNVHGHRREEIDSAVREQLDRIAHSTLLGLANAPSALLAERLVRIGPGSPARVFYSDNGSTAAEVALKMAFQYFRRRSGGEERQAFFRFTGAYHGDTLGSVSVGGIDLFFETFRPLTFRTVTVTAPHCYRCPFGQRAADCDRACFTELEKAFEKEGARCAAAIIEPVVQAAAGIVLQPEGYLRRLRELCDRFGVLLIADEVATGFGRTGKMFACEHEGVAPDLCAMAKGISAGYLPLAATLTTQEVFDGFLDSNPSRGTFFHGHTYTGNPLACAAGLASLDLFEKDRTLEKAGAGIHALAQTLESVAELPCVGDVRQKGMLAGIELVADRDRAEPYPPEMRMGARAAMEARRRGAIIRPLGDVVVLCPPLCITPDQIRELVDITREAIEAATSG
jgi:adenosylmethionine-8-amino-7-oxononanoate aminotransferase